MMVAMIETFWRYVDKTGRIWGTLNQNSYGVYINHVILIGGVWYADVELECICFGEISHPDYLNLYQQQFAGFIVSHLEAKH
jgi:hypothetical protein